jgi:hypothetical protein
MLASFIKTDRKGNIMRMGRRTVPELEDRAYYAASPTGISRKEPRFEAAKPRRLTVVFL